MISFVNELCKIIVAFEVRTLDIIYRKKYIDISIIYKYTYIFKIKQANY